MTIETTEENDIHFVMMPTLTTDKYENCSVAGMDLSNSGVTYGAIGTLTAVKVPTGMRTFPDGSGPVDLSLPGYSSVALDVSTFSINTSVRVVSAGFEVHNTSPEVFKSGSVVVYRMPQTRHLTAMRLVDGVDPQVQYQIYRARLPPATQAAALAHPGAHMWEAFDGNYNVAVISHPDTAHLRDYNSMCFLGRDTLGNFDPVNSLVIRELPQPDGRLYPSIDLSGAYYAGINAGCSLTATLKVFLEIFPTGQDGVIQLLSQPSPPHDQTALDIYARAVGKLPPGCKVADNNGGDWWRAAVDVVNTIAPRAVGIARETAKIAKPLVKAFSKTPQINQNRNFGQDSLARAGPNKTKKLINRNR